MSLIFLEARRPPEKVPLDGESLRPWLLGIATNVPRNAARSARRHEAALNRTPVRDMVPEAGEPRPASGSLQSKGLTAEPRRRAPRERRVQNGLWSRGRLRATASAVLCGTSVRTVYT